MVCDYYIDSESSSGGRGEKESEDGGSGGPDKDSDGSESEGSSNESDEIDSNSKSQDLSMNNSNESNNELIEQNNENIPLKDHKENFELCPTCRLLNPAKSEIGIISKVILDRVSNKIRNANKINQWRVPVTSENGLIRLKLPDAANS